MAVTDGLCLIFVYQEKLSCASGSELICEMPSGLGLTEHWLSRAELDWAGLPWVSQWQAQAPALTGVAEESHRLCKISFIINSLSVVAFSNARCSSNVLGG